MGNLGQLKPKRVLVAHNVERGGRGGMALMMESMHAALEEFGWQTEYFTASDLSADTPPRLRRYGFTWQARRHARQAYLAGRPYSIVNIHEPAGVALVFGKAALGNPAIVAMSHGLEQRYWEMRLQSGSSGPEPPSLKERVSFPLLSLWQSSLTLRRADHVICSNEVDKQFLVDRLRVEPEKITLLLHPAGEDFARVAPRRDYTRPCTKIVFSGTWTGRKGIRQLIESFTVLAAKYPQLQLGILGAGLAADRVRADFPEPLRARIAVYSSASHAEAAEILLDYDIFLVPSFFEGGPLTLTEAMASGMPAITTSSWMRQLVQDGENCLLIPPGDAAAIVRAVERLMQDAGLREKMGRQAHADVTQKYTWRALAERIDKAYSGLLKL
jgi:glycosyltransferase involved in cell wall biosynthesis